LIENSDVNTFSVPIFGIVVDNGSLGNSGINLELSSEEAVRSIELHVLESALSCLKISSRQSLNLAILKSAIIVIETFASRASRGSEVSEVFHLPVSPPSKMFVTGVTDLVDFFDAD
jgi:hypothetical protein